MLVRSCNMHEGDEKCIQNFGHKPSKKDISVDGERIDLIQIAQNMVQ
jgi:hypothetical protein